MTPGRVAQTGAWWRLKEAFSALFLTEQSLAPLLPEEAGEWWS